MPTSQCADTYWSELYDDGRDFTLITSAVLTRILSFADDSVPKNCLDIGCGTGQLSRELYHRGYQSVGIDIAASAVGIARSLSVVPREELEYLHFDIEHDDLSKLPRQPYSLIICKLVYAFIANKSAFLDTVRHMLLPNGLFVVVTPHTNDVVAERRGIAVDDTELDLLSSRFKQLALYKGRERVEPLTYFVGR